MLRVLVMVLLAGGLFIGCQQSASDAPATTAEDPQESAAPQATAPSANEGETEGEGTNVVEENEEEGAPDAEPAAEPVAEAEGENTESVEGLPATNYYAIETPQGRMVIKLYDETPQHRDNFKKLVAEGTLDDTQFHRIIKGFMIQGGDPNSKDDDPMDDGQGGPGYTVPAEFRPELFHKKGALSAARQPDQVNPERRSSGSQFYIVQGTPWSESELDEHQARVRQSIQDPNFTFSPEARAAYMNQGGTPFLDAQYTVFGELVEGEAVLDAIADTPTPRAQGQRVHPALVDHPADPIRMTVTPLADYQE